MRWVTYTSSDGSARAGLVLGDQVHGLAPGTQVLDLLGDDGGRMAEAADLAARAPAEVVALAGADLRAPLQPPQVRDFLTFLDHLRNAQGGPDTKLDEVWEQTPAFYFSNIAAVVGPHDPVPISPGCEWFDFELEVAAVVGRHGRDLHPDTAEEVIAGFTVLNDWSARDLQYREMRHGLGPAKGKDGATTLGPMLVTVDELEAHRRDGRWALRMQAFVNDEQLTDGSMDQMHWSWGEMLAYASRGTTLLPGDVIGSGTVPMGCLVEHAQARGEDFGGWLQPGDVVRLEVEELGVTRQEVQPAPPVHRLRSGF
jgi:2-keto-4-pentenoate hydratase/2-oxohepta-3-ene-1,7-dioic acid hydratase in catechol pathway